VREKIDLGWVFRRVFGQKEQKKKTMVTWRGWKHTQTPNGGIAGVDKKTLGNKWGGENTKGEKWKKTLGLGVWGKKTKGKKKS